MKPNQTLAEALSTAKQLRRAAASPTAAGAFNSDRPEASETATDPPAEPTASQESPSRWVRHTVGLRAETSLKLRDAADAQKRKVRYGKLKLGEPSNEQEIAELGIGLALRRLNLE